MSDTRRWVIIGAGALMVVGSFMPWVQSGIVSLPGTQGDGIFTVIFGALVALIGLAKRDTRLTGILLLIISAIGAFIPLNIIGSIDAELAGGGLFVTLLGGGLGALAGFGMTVAPADQPNEDAAGEQETS